MQLLVLAGGFGTRLRDAVADVPKALAPVGATPFLQLQIEHWLAQGVRQFTFLLHHQAEQIVAFLKAQRDVLPKDCKLEWLIEPAPFGTGGAIANAVRELDLSDDFLIANADTWLGGGIREILGATVPSIAVVNLADVSRYGQVQFDNDLRVLAFVEKDGQCGSGWINAGLCHLSCELFKNWDKNAFSLERALFPQLVQDGLLTATPLETTFIDIGIADDYHRFCCWFSTGRKGPLCS